MSNSTQNKCPFCKSELISLVLPSNPPQYKTYCPNCEKYKVSNSTQNDEIKQIEKAIYEGFVESEKAIKGMKTPFDKPAQNNEPIINGEWGSPAPNKVDRWVKKDSTQNWEKELRSKLLERLDFLSDHWINGDDKPPFNFGGWREEVADAFIKIYKKYLADARREVIQRVMSVLPLGDDPRYRELKDVLAALKEEIL